VLFRSDNREIGAIAIGAGAALELVDSAVVGTRSATTGLSGGGLEVSGGAALRATGVWVASVRERGVALFGPGTTGDLRDVLVRDVVPSARGAGAGAVAFGGAHLAVARVAVLDVHGIGLGAVPLDVPAVGPLGGQLDGVDVFVRDVGSSVVQVVASGATPRRVAYGLHAGAASALALERVVLVGGGYGFFLSAGGTLAIRTGVVTDQLDGVGAADGARDALTLEQVVWARNATDHVLRDQGLPQAAGLPLPTPVCTDLTCP
jgi:hypothetical protein